MVIEIPNALFSEIRRLKISQGCYNTRLVNTSEIMEINTQYGIIALKAVEDDKWLEEVPTTKKVWRQKHD